MAKNAAFRGFADGTFRFLGGVARNNRKDWFEAHRADYEAHYVAPAKALVVAVGPLLQKVAPQVQCEPRINGSIGRINRDIRFSNDKSPYKNHLDLWFWHGHEKGWEAPGFFFRLTEKKMILGAGMHMFSKEQLAAYRAAVLESHQGAGLAKAIAAVTKAGYKLGGATRKRVPRGYDDGHPLAALLRHDGLYAVWEGPVPREARMSSLPAWCAQHWRAQWPIGKWLQSVLPT